MITATGYGPENILFRYGYSESRVGDSRYSVDYTCNEKTSLAVCDGYLYRRCAELTRNAGYDYFVMDEHTSYIMKWDNEVPGYFKPVDSKSGPTTYLYVPGYVQTRMEPNCRAKIMMYRGAKPEGGKSAFTADEILRNIEK